MKEIGLEVVLVNSNPATIMTDVQMAGKTYIEPLITERLEEIMAKERPDALLPSLGGQTGLNLAMDLAKKGILEKYEIELIGCSAETIYKAEDREAFKQMMLEITSLSLKALLSAQSARVKYLPRKSVSP